MRTFETIAVVAARQHGAISVDQLRELDMSAKAQRSAVAAGRLTMVESTVAVVAGSPDTWHRRLQVGLLALGEEAWVSHEAAAALHGLDRALPDAVEFTVLRPARRDLATGRVHTTDHVGRLDLVMVDGFRCSSATRTIIDLAYLGIPLIRLEGAIDSSVRLGLSAGRVLAERLDELRGPGRRGARALDKLLIDSGGESPLERRFLAVLRRTRLPRPTTQVTVRDERRHVARVDFLFDPYRIVVEVTGRKGHSSPSERQRDAHRRNELTDRNYLVYEYTWEDVITRPEHVASTMRCRLVSAGWMPSRVHVD